jgi:hypothetical protein
MRPIAQDSWEVTGLGELWVRANFEILLKLPYLGKDSLPVAFLR